MLWIKCWDGSYLKYVFLREMWVAYPYESEKSHGFGIKVSISEHPQSLGEYLLREIKTEVEAVLTLNKLMAELVFIDDKNGIFDPSLYLMYGKNHEN